MLVKLAQYRWLVMVIFVALMTINTSMSLAQTFDPAEETADAFTRLMNNKVARTIVFIAVAGIGIGVVGMRGHGIEIALMAFVIIIGLIFMLAGPEWVFRQAGWHEI